MHRIATGQHLTAEQNRIAGIPGFDIGLGYGIEVHPSCGCPDLEGHFWPITQ